MPGVLIIEALAQAGALYAARLTKFDPERQVIYFMAIDKAKFRKPVVPGDHLILEVTPLRKGGRHLEDARRGQGGRRGGRRGRVHGQHPAQTGLAGDPTCHRSPMARSSWSPPNRWRILA